MATDISTSELKQVHEDRKKAQRETYRKIYLQVCDKIDKVNKQFYVKNCTYHIPVMMWGLPLYKMEECLIYIRWRLKKKGIVTKFTYPNLLYISWEKIVDSKASTIEKIAEKDEEKSRKHEYVEDPIRWDNKIIDEKNDRTIEERKYREEYRRRRRKRHRLQREEREQERYQRHKQEEIEEIIRNKNKQALYELEYGSDTDRPKKKILQITT